MCNLVDIMPLANLAHGSRFVEPSKTETSLSTLFGRTIYLVNESDLLDGLPANATCPVGYETKDFFRALTQEKFDRHTSNV